MRTKTAMSANGNDQWSPQATGFRDMDTLEEGGGCATPRDSAFRKMVLKIANNLSKDNVETIVFLYNLPQDLNQSTSLHVLNVLLKRNFFSTRNVKPLKELLQSIHRSDLVSDVVEDYLTRIGRYNSSPVPKSPKLFATRRRHYSCSMDHLTIPEETRAPHLQLQGVPPVCAIRFTDSQRMCPLPANAYDDSSDQTKITNSPRPRCHTWSGRQSSHGNFLTVDSSHIRSGPPSSVTSLSPFSSTNSLVDEPITFAVSTPIPVPSNGDHSKSRHNNSSSRLSSTSNTPYSLSPSPNSQETSACALHTSSAPNSHHLLVQHTNTCPLFQQHDSQQVQTEATVQIPLQPLPTVHGSSTPNTRTSPPVHPPMEPTSLHLQISVVPTTAPLHRAGFAQTLSAAKSDSRLDQTSPECPCRTCSQNPTQQHENETQQLRHATPDLLAGAHGPLPERETTALNNSAEVKGSTPPSILPNQPSSHGSHTTGRQQPQPGKPAHSWLRPPWRTPTTHRRELSWRLKRSELTEAICEHKETKFYSSPQKLTVELGHGRANPRLAMRLFPCGLEDDRKQSATLEISIEVPKKCPRLNSNAKADISLSVWDCKENALLGNEQQLSVAMNMRTVLVKEFVSHSRLIYAQSEHVEIKATIT